MTQKSEVELKCPKCGNDGKTGDRNKMIQYFEWIPNYQNVEAVEDGVVYLDHPYDFAEAAKDPGFYCNACDTEWPKPNGVVSLGNIEEFVSRGGKKFSSLDD